MFTREQLQEVQLFLALLYDWTDAGEELYKSVTWTFTGKDGGIAFANYAAQKMDGLIALIERRAKLPAANVYVCLGTQKAADATVLSQDGFPKAIRQHKNIVSFKSVALDIDVGKPGAYATTADADAALNDFCRVTGMPEPTMIVESGSGGLHVYWCFVDPVDKPHWDQIAKGLQTAAGNYGLKFDPQVTVNPAGILRVPHTLNHKRQPATPVVLRMKHNFPRYSYQQIVAGLGANVGTMALAMNPRANKQRSSNFSAGISESSPPVSIEDVAVNCAVIDDILEREGDGDAEPLWNLALYAASFTDDPHAAAHELSRGDARYVFADTEKKLIEKINARANNPQAGWPTCESFNALHPACAVCPLFAAKKTPFHHARRPVNPTAAATSQQFVAASSDPLMPTGYWRNKDGHVFTMLYDKKTGDAHAAEVINYPILDAGIDPENGTLLYRCIVGGTTMWREINVSTSMQPQAAAGALAKGHGLYIPTRHHTAARDFLVSWVAHLQNLRKMTNQAGYGWTEDGFAFDDKIYRRSGVTTVFRGKHHDPNFTAKGDLKPWQNAMQLLYGNQPLETIVASAFAAPLVELIGSASLVLSIYSALSGVGKTTAMMLAQAVWGHPRAGMSTLADTTNSMMKKISDLKSLPIYWDELRTKEQLEKVIDIVFQVTQGKAKARLNRDITQAEAPIFTTMFVVASNYGIGDTVYSQTESTQAGGLRLFEIEATPLTSTMSDYDARQLVIPLQSNFGVAGALYAEYIAANREAIKQVLKHVADDLNSRHGFAPKERFWSMVMTSLLVGATLANHIGLTRFDLQKLTAYVDQVFRKQRLTMKTQEYATMEAATDVVGLLNEMLQQQRNRHLIVTETIPYAYIGKPTPLNLVDTDMSRLTDVWIQLGDKDKRIRLRVRQFHMWLRDHKLNPVQIVEMLRQHYHITQSKQTIGAGVPGLDALAKFGRAECYDLTPLNVSSPSPDSGVPS